jgi:predicted lipoprotein
MIMNRIYSALTFALLLLACVSCGEEADKDPSDLFDRSAYLEYTANALIIPAYQDLDSRTGSLHTAAEAFANAPSLAGLQALQTAWTQANTQWQACAAFEFGPAAEVLLRASLNTFPADAQKIETNISSGNTDLSSVNQLQARGFPALDYLLFSGDDDSIVGAFTSSQARKDYLLALTQDIYTLSHSVYESWINGYGNDFASNDGNDVGSSLGMLVNQLNFYYETVKNQNLGIPVGKRSLGTPLPDQVEAPHSQQSLAFIQASISHLQRLFNGQTSSGNDGIGLDDYLTALNAQYNGAPLADAINAQFNSALAALNEVPAPLQESVINAPDACNAAYTELQKMVVLMKSDLPSALGVLITYADNDGD